ncbi:MAG: DNA-directed RNA polymerase subunit A' [Methanomicrobia archaeon]|nr:DNA-directed RNA polymerase subunit A' [Methanomicrobia archaeon]
MLEEKQIEKIRFGLMSPETIRKLSVAKIMTADTYDDEGYPIERGLMDPRLGVIDPGLKCRTCGQKFGKCSGHFGHIELARPVIHIGFVKDIYMFLKSTCRECGRILLSDKELEAFRKKIGEAKDVNADKEVIIKDLVKEATKKKTSTVNNTCPHCGAVQKKVKLERPTTFMEENDKLTPSDIREWLEKISDDDMRLLGWDPDAARIEWTVLTVLPVAPVTVRPSITLESGIRSEDDLTHKLVDIIRINQRLRENIDAGAPHLIVEDLWELLQYHVTTYLDNEVAGIPPARHRSGRILKTLTQRLKGKEGRFRHNLSGKRVDFSSRTVISPDPYISINEIGVPVQIAKELTVPEKVTEQNIEELRKLILNGPNKHPGANYVIRRDGRKKRVTDEIKEIIAEELEVGFIVERHLRDGDIVLFNRQPSLHRLSIMAHRVKVMPYKTFRLNLCVCPPYGADFDGDEMNLHVPQTEEAQVEAETLMKVQQQIVSPRFGEPVIGAMQDYVSGAYILTKEGTVFTEEETEEMLYFAGIDKFPEEYMEKDGKRYYTGKEIFSLLIPDDMNLEYKAKICRKCEVCLKEKCPDDAYVVIKNGKLIHGVIDGATFKARSKSLFLSKLVRVYGTDTAREFIDKGTKLLLWALMKKGLTTGIDDADIPKEASERIERILKEGEKKVEKLIEVYERGELEPLPGRTTRETLESKIMQVLSEARDKAGEIAEKHLGMNRHAVIMARTGAKGNILDLTQIAASLGQMSVRGERLSRGYTERSLSHYKKGEMGAKSQGFVANSFKEGLNPREFFFHAMGGREGLVDTAVRTAQSGYMQRRLMNALQDVRVEYNGVVKDQERIVQFRYGEDGVDPSKSEYGKPVDIDWIIYKNLKSEAI